MKVDDAVARLRAAVHDESGEFPFGRCLELLTTAARQANALLVAGRYAPIARTCVLGDGDPLPEGFMQAAGSYPVRIEDGRVRLLDEDEGFVKMRYFAGIRDIAEEDEDMPFANDAINEAVVDAAVMRALNENEYDVTQDGSLAAALSQAVMAGIGLADGGGR